MLPVLLPPDFSRLDYRSPGLRALVWVTLASCGRDEVLPAPSVVAGGPLPCRGDGLLHAVVDPSGLWTSCRDADAPLSGALARIDRDPPTGTLVVFPTDVPLGHVIAVATGSLGRDGLGIVWQVRDSGDLAAGMVTKSGIAITERMPGRSVESIVGVWIADGTLHHASRADGATATVAPGGAALGCSGATGGTADAVWPDGRGLRVLITSGERAWTCLAGEPPAEVSGFAGLAALDRSVAGLVGLHDAGIADTRLAADGSVVPIPAEARGKAVHELREGRLLRRARGSDDDAMWTETAAGRVTLTLDYPQVSVDGGPAVDASAAPSDLWNAVLLPIDDDPGTRTFFTQTGLWFTVR